MATVSVVISGGGSVSAAVGYTAACASGAGVAVGSVSWNTSTARRKGLDWLPRPDHPISTCPHCKTKLRLDPLWYGFIKEMSENRLGGAQGVTLPAVVTTVQQTQATVVDTTATLAETIAYARSIDATATALAQVAVDNGQTGATTVPEPADPPQPPGTHLV